MDHAEKVVQHEDAYRRTTQIWYLIRKLFFHDSGSIFYAWLSNFNSHYPTHRTHKFGSPKDQAIQKTLALHVAAELGFTVIFLELFEPDHSKRVDETPPLVYALQYNHAKVVRHLLKLSTSDVNLSDKKGVTPLHVAMYKSRLDMIELLLGRRDLDLNPRDIAGLTPLMVAIVRGHKSSEKSDVRKGLRLLLKHERLDVNLTDYTGRTPLHHAVCAKTDSFEISMMALRELLKRQDIILNLKDDNGKTPLILALEAQYDEAADLLRKHGAEEPLQSEINEVLAMRSEAKITDSNTTAKLVKFEQQTETYPAENGEHPVGHENSRTAQIGLKPEGGSGRDKDKVAVEARAA
jgi:ankyrin repeat protein